MFFRVLMIEKQLTLKEAFLSSPAICQNLLDCKKENNIQFTHAVHFLTKQQSFVVKGKQHEYCISVNAF